MDNMDKKHKIWLHHLQEEIDAAYLYALLEQKTNNTNER
jgi:hypothetical protein